MFIERINDDKNERNRAKITATQKSEKMRLEKNLSMYNFTAKQ